jgi:hypothetical protein
MQIPTETVASLLYCESKDASEKQKLRVLSWDVDAANQEKSWVDRFEDALRVIQSSEAAVICLQGLTCGKTAERLSYFLARTGLHFEYKRASPLPETEALVVLYDATRLYPLVTYHKWLSSTPNSPSDTWDAEEGKGHSLMAMSFAFLEDSTSRIICGKTPLWVFNTKFSEHSCVSRYNSCHFLIKNIPIICKSAPWVLAGNFCFYEDDVLQKAVLDNADFHNALTPATVTLDGRRCMATYSPISQKSARRSQSSPCTIYYDATRVKALKPTLHISSAQLKPVNTSPSPFLPFSIELHV